MNMIDMKMKKTITIKEMATQTEEWTAIIEATQNKDLKKALGELYEAAKETFGSVKLFHSDVQDEFSEYKDEHTEYDQAAKLFRESRIKINELENSGENPELLEELKIESKVLRENCNKEFADAHKEAFEYVDAKRKMEEMREDFQDFVEATKALMEEIKKYNARYAIPKFRDMDISHFYEGRGSLFKGMRFLKAKLAKFQEIIARTEKTAAENAEIQSEVYRLITQNRVDLDKVAQILYKRLREKGQKKVASVSEKFNEIGLKGPLIRTTNPNNNFDINLTFSREEMVVDWHAIGLLPKLKSMVTITNSLQKKKKKEFEANLADNEDENELAQKIAKIMQELKQ